MAGINCISFDVKSLLTSIPVNLAHYKRETRQDPNLGDHTSISITNIMQLLDFVLKEIYFKHDSSQATSTSQLHHDLCN